MKRPLGHQTSCGSFFILTLFCLLLFFSGTAFAGDMETGAKPSTYVYTKPARVGDPISAANGAYYFTIPLLGLGGPMDLRFELIYRSDYWRDFQCLPWQFWWRPFAYAQSGTVINSIEYITVYLPNGDHVSFKKSAGEWVLTDPSVDVYGYVYKDNIPPTKYRLKETAGFAYLMDPINELVCIFERLMESNNYFRIRRILDRNGNQITYTYSTNMQQPTKIEDGLGRSLSFTYESISHWDYIKTVTDQGGRKIEFKYEAQGADNNNGETLRSVKDPMGHETSFQYAGRVMFLTNLIASQTLPRGNKPYTQTYGQETFNNNSFPRVITQKDALGNLTTLTYNTPNDSLTATRPDGNTEKYEHYSSHGLLKSLTDPASKKAEFTKDADEHITGVTDRIGDSTSFAYHAETGKLASITNAKGNTVTYTYTAQDQSFTNPLLLTEQVTFRFYNLTKIDYPDGTNEQFTYDTKGNMTQRTDRAGKVWGYDYNNRGQVTKIANPTGGTVEYTYSATDATLTSSKDSDMGTTTYGYDTYKRLTGITRPDGTFIQIAYNLNNQVTSVTDESNHTYTYQYDTNGNLTKIIDPAGKETEYEYDDMDRIKKVINRLDKESNFSYNNMGRLQTITDPNGLETNFGYDPRGWLNAMTLGGETWQTGYDDEGIVSSRKTPLNNTTTYQSDKLGFITGITNPLNQTTTLSRDSMSRIMGITDPLNRTTTYTYDSRGLPSGVTMPLIGTATYQRNDLGLLSQIIDLKGSNWTFDYTNVGRLKSKMDPLGNTWQYGYDTLGRPSTTTFPEGTTATRTYDFAGNITRLLYSADPDLQFSYDALDRLLTANNLTLTRDDEGRITNTENPGTNFGATYDDGGRLKKVTYNNNAFAVSYSYDTTTGLLSSVTDNLTSTQIDFTYDNDRRMTGITRSNGVNTAFTWDNASRLIRIQDGPSTGSGFIDLQYTLDAVGQVTQTNMTVPLDPASLLESGAETFTYDAAARVNTTGYTYDQQGRLTAALGSTFNWDGASRLIGINSTTLAYNGLGDLITRTESGNTIRYYYNYAIGLKPIVAEKDESTEQFQRYYVWTPGGRLVYVIDAANGNKVYFYHFDRTGSTLALTDSTGAVTDNYAYDPYGELLGHQGTSAQPFAFVGEWGVRQEGSSGILYHMRGRYYDVRAGRFISPDLNGPSILAPRQINPYEYAFNAPNKYVDISGLAPEEAGDPKRREPAWTPEQQRQLQQGLGDLNAWLGERRLGRVEFEVGRNRLFPAFPNFKWDAALLNKDAEAAIRVHAFAKKWCRIFWGDQVDERALRELVEWEFYFTFATLEQGRAWLGKREAVLKQLGQMRYWLERHLKVRIAIATHRRAELLMTPGVDPELAGAGLRAGAWAGILGEADMIIEKFDIGALSAEEAFQAMEKLLKTPDVTRDPVLDPKYNSL